MRYLLLIVVLVIVVLALSACAPPDPFKGCAKAKENVRIMEMCLEMVGCNMDTWELKQLIKHQIVLSDCEAKGYRREVDWYGN